ncbi:hypothetical protein AMAG_16188 [Allomyces macrogynus ATCC 38327]|uniref:Small GTP-binding protein domain n=1 Tax=Allomyces macrogynus (strain ATCC 38327) TaxID=578462 RepID=A0A0L0TA98_ALLM3|nr:hypothetical protein AMAG_16188 [Allomyces macrogynus ATCC 38327]|eukprot:KNE71630.1 hypothetical protein AMAG_16188 [Allomyces macrogynus ATCC 38327]
MSSIFKSLLDWLRSLFFTQEMEVTLVGLQASGKSTLVNVFASGEFTEDTIPTVGFQYAAKSPRAKFTMKFVVDSADHGKLEAAKQELRNLLERPTLSNVPLLVLGNKNDLPNALTVEGVIDALELKSYSQREIACYSVSAKNQINIDITLQWLTKHAP